MGPRLRGRASAVWCLTAGLAAVAGAQVPPPTTGSELLPEPAGTSQVRVVRLSQVQGLVQMDRSAGRGYEQAIVNMPVVSHARLRTGQGVAEVEFEDNSSLRLAPGSEVRFAQLSRSPDGSTITTVDAVRGTVYVSLRSSRTGNFALNDGAAHLLLTPGTHVRLRAGDGDDALAVWQGTAELQLGSADTSLHKKQSLTFDPAQSTVSAVSGGVEEASWDSWDHQASQYHDVRANQAFGSGGGGGFGFGSADMGYYGSFADLPGCGSVWRPYLTGTGWSPYDNGSWALYQGGYSWVSPYPWGWLPYHSGSWVNCGTGGWGWRPGSQWYGLHNGKPVRVTNAPHIPGRPLPFPVAPVSSASLIRVDAHPLPASGADVQGEHFIFRQNSAGLGVPRTGLGDMHRVSEQAGQRGMVSRALAGTLHSEAVSQSSAASWGSASHASGAAPQAMHQSTSSMTSSPTAAGSSHATSSVASGSVGGSSGGGSPSLGGGASSGAAARSH